MSAYFLIFTIASFLSILNFHNFNYSKKFENIFRYFFIILLISFMGFKYYVGGDWGTYNNYYNSILDYKINFYNFSNDLLFYFLNYFIKKINLGFYLINIFSALIGILGIHLLARINNNNYWLFFLLLLPYFIFVIMMGYTRQSISIGLFFIGLSFLLKDLNQKNILIYVILIIIAFFFHKTVVILILAPIFLINRNFFTFSFISLCTFFFIFFLIFIILNDRVLDRFEYFFQNQYSSIGGFIRSFVIFFLCLCYFSFFSLFSSSYYNKKIIYFFSLFCFFISIFIIIIPSTVIIDRILLYFYFLIPVYVSILYENCKNSKNRKIIFYFTIFLGYLVIFVWFNFAENANSWVPYKIYPLL